MPIILNVHCFLLFGKILNKSANHKNMDSDETIIYFENKIDINPDKRFWPSKVADEIQCFCLQD